MLGRIDNLRHIARLRRGGLAIGWNVEVMASSPRHVEHGRNCRVGRGSILSLESGKLILGDDVHLGAYSNVRATMSRIEIGSRVLFAQFVSLIGTNHEIGPDGAALWHVKDQQRSGIRIGDDCWLGAQSIVLPGVELGDRCVVGAGAVVTKSFPAGSRLVGNPARAL